MKLLRFDQSARMLHWSHAIVFLWLLISGVQLFLTQASLLANPAIRLVHLYAAPLFPLLPVIILKFCSKDTRNDVRELMTWTKDDLNWFIAYVSLKKPKVRGKFDAGQKADFLITILLITGLTFSGAVVWIRQMFSVEFVELNFFAHDVLTILAVLLFSAHLLFGLYYRALHGIIYGEVDDEWAKAHFPGWSGEQTGSMK